MWWRVPAITAVMTALCGGSAAYAVTLQDAVETTLQTNPEVIAIRDNRRAIDQELRAARGLYYPSIDLRGEYGYEVTKSTVGDGFGWLDE